MDQHDASLPARHVRGGFLIMDTSALPDYLRAFNLSGLTPSLAGLEFVERSLRGVIRRLYRWGRPDAETVVLLPPFGVTFLLVARLAALLAREYHVLVWESAGSPDPSCPAAEDDFSLDVQSADIEVMVGDTTARSYHFVGWCQAAQLAVHAIATRDRAPRTMTWIAPGGFGQRLVVPEFDRCALPVYLAIERQGPAAADKLGRILDKYRAAPLDAPLTGEWLTMLHLASPAMTHIFARYMKCFADHQPIVAPLLGSALDQVPTQLLHSRDDTYSHYSESVQIARNHPSVELHLMDKGGHFQVFDDPAPLAARVSAFIRSSQTTPAPVVTSC